MPAGLCGTRIMCAGHSHPPMAAFNDGVDAVTPDVPRTESGNGPDYEAGPVRVRNG